MTVIRIKERVKTFNARMIVYEEDGELKIYSAPATTPYEEFVANFEREKGVRFDPATGACRPLEKVAQQEPETPRENETTPSKQAHIAQQPEERTDTAEVKHDVEPQSATDDLAPSRQ